MFKKHVTLAVFVSFISLSFIYAQNLTEAKSAIQSYLNLWFINPSPEEEWFLEIKGMKFPVKGLEVGLASLENNLNKGKVSAEEKKQIKAHFIQTYTDQSAILADSYQELLDNPQTDILLQEFLRQAATQLWLEKQVAANPDAINPTQEEIDAYYTENSDRLFRLGLSASQIQEYAEQELRQTKIQKWSFDQLKSFKEKNPITINEKYKKKYKIN